MALFEVIVSNVFNSMEETIELPTTKERVREVCCSLSISSVENFKIIGVSNCFDMPYNHFAHDSINELNWLATLIEEMDLYDLDKLRAVFENNYMDLSAQRLINLCDNLDNYELYGDIFDDEELGQYYIDEFHYNEVPEFIRDYINYGRYGEDIRYEECGYFSSYGYLIENGGSFIEDYDGDEENIPDEYIVLNDDSFETDLLSDDDTMFVCADISLEDLIST